MRQGKVLQERQPIIIDIFIVAALVKSHCHSKHVFITLEVFVEFYRQRSDIFFDHLRFFDPELSETEEQVAVEVETRIKYEGYILKQLKEIEKCNDLENKKIPENFDFAALHGLSNELKEKLSTIRPVSLGQASRIDGMTPVALSVLMIGLKARARN